MTETITKFVEKLGWKISNYSWDGNAHLFYVEEPGDLEIKFEELRLAFKKVSDLGPEKVFPMLKRAGDDLILVLIPQPSFDYVQSKTNLYLLFATIFSTTWAGALWWASYSDADVLNQSSAWLRVLITPEVLLMGFLTYSLPLMAILGAHEMGHYYYAKKHTALYEARNLAIEKSKGDLIAFLDTDDLWEKDKLELQMHHFNNSEVGLVFSNLWLIKGNTKKKNYI